jgi:class 3 adenylate cyclase
MDLPFWELRLGIHSGSVVGGVIGKTKFAFDIWGDTVNLASRMESSGDVSRVNISEQTYDLVKDFFDCEYRGEIDAKNKGKVKMYFINGIKSELSVDGKGRVPNDKFNLIYGNL